MTYSIITSFRNDMPYASSYVKGLFNLREEEKAQCDEIFLINDNSTDETEKCLDDLSASFHLSLFLASPERTWIHENFNQALHFISSPYFMRLDADTMLMPGYVSSCLEKLKEDHIYSCGGIIEDKASAKWIQRASLHPRRPWGTARFYDTKKLKEMGGFHGTVKENMGKTVYDEDSITDDIAKEKYNFATAIVPNARALHLRPLSTASLYAANSRKRIMLESMRSFDFSTLLDCLHRPSSSFR